MTWAKMKITYRCLRINVFHINKISFSSLVKSNLSINCKLPVCVNASSKHNKIIIEGATDISQSQTKPQSELVLKFYTVNQGELIRNSTDHIQWREAWFWQADKVFNLIRIRTWIWCSSTIRAGFFLFHIWIVVLILYVVWNLVGSYAIWQFQKQMKARLCCYSNMLVLKETHQNCWPAESPFQSVSTALGTLLDQMTSR